MGSAVKNHVRVRKRPNNKSGE